MKLTEEEFYKSELQMGISGKNPDFVALTKKTYEQLIIKFDTVLDYGAGMGVYANTFHEAGKKVYVWDKFKIHKEHIKFNYPYLNILNEPITTDLMLFIEVAEHMTDKQIDNLFKKIKPNYILFSSTSDTSPRDEDWGHINIKPQVDWVSMFEKIGYQLSGTLQYPTHYTKLFQCVY